MNTKIGYIEISKEALESFWYAVIKVIPLKIEQEKYNGCYKYLVQCEYFRELSEGEYIPTYNFEFIKSEISNKTIVLNVTETITQNTFGKQNG